MEENKSGVIGNSTESSLDTLYNSWIKACDDSRILPNNEKRLSGINLELESKLKEKATIDKKLNSTKGRDKIASIESTIKDKQANIEKLNNDCNGEVMDGKLYITECLQNESAALDKKKEAELAKYDAANSSKGNLTDYEKTALGLARERDAINKTANVNIDRESKSFSEFEEETNKKISGYNEQIKSIKLAYKDEISSWQSKVSAIQAKWNPSITAQDQKCDEIKQEYNSELSSLDAEIDRIQRVAASQISTLNSEYRRVDKDFKRQIKDAEKAGRATTRLNTSRTSQLNKIQTDITKAQNARDKDISKVESKQDQLQAKYQKKLDAASEAYNSLIDKRDRELERPQGFLNALISERDGKIADVQRLIDAGYDIINSQQSIRDKKIAEQNNIRNTRLNEVKNKAIDFIKSGDTCYNETLAEAYKPFEQLKSGMDNAMNLKEALIKNVGEKKVDKAYSESKKNIYQLDYEQLTINADSAYNYDFSTVPFLTNIKAVVGIAAGVGLVAALILYFVMKLPLAACIVPVVVLPIIAWSMSNSSSSTLLTKLSNYIILATEYAEMPAILQYSDDKTTTLELNKITELGDNLLKADIGRHKIEEYYDAETNKLVDKYYKLDEEQSEAIVNKYNKLIESTEAEIDKLQKEKMKLESDIENTELEGRDRLIELEGIIDGLERDKKDAEYRIARSKRSILEFTELYGLKIDDIDTNIPPISNTHGVLSNNIYVIPDNDEILSKAICSLKDDTNSRGGYKPIVKIRHDKKPFIILYNSDDAHNSPKAFNEALGNITNSILFDLMAAFRRVNSKGVFENSLIDTVSNGTAFVNQGVRNLLSISTVTKNQYDMRGKLEEIAKNSEKIYQEGVSIDAVNEARYEDGDKPPVKYNILYFVINPGLTEELSDAFKAVLANSDQFGFIPVFLCEEQAYNDGIEKDTGIYSELSKLTNNIVKFDHNYNTK